MGDTVDVVGTSHSHEIGIALLTGGGEDTDFDPADRAFYYVRVL